MNDIPPIKIVLKLGDDGVKTLSELAQKTGSAIVGYCSSALDMIIPQRRIWAFNNYKKFIEYYENENKKRKDMGKKPILPRFAHPAFQVIGEEDDDDMLTLWARLMSNLQDENLSIQENRAFIGMLQSMEPIDAHVLKWICDTQRDDGNHPFVYIEANQAAENLNLSRQQLLLSMHNLSRLGALNTVGLLDMSDQIVINTPKHHGMRPGLAVVMFETMYFRLTTLGVALVDACRPAGDPATLSTSANFD